jgi:multisubunit Na+/H+ antiporter MnhB subunit
MPETDEETSEETDREPEQDESGLLAEVRTTAEDEATRLQAGSSVPLLGARMPVRVLVALAVFVTVFTIVWAAVWGLAGGLGLALGWIPAAAGGLFAIALAGRLMSD